MDNKILTSIQNQIQDEVSELYYALTSLQMAKTSKEKRNAINDVIAELFDVLGFTFVIAGVREHSLISDDGIINTKLLRDDIETLITAICIRESSTHKFTLRNAFEIFKDQDAERIRWFFMMYWSKIHLNYPASQVIALAHDVAGHGLLITMRIINRIDEWLSSN